MFVPLALSLDHAITVEDVLKVAGAGFVVVLLIGALAWFLSKVGDGFSR